jgi:uncharacterized protein YjbI with pentapeptide repeats
MHMHNAHEALAVHDSDVTDPRFTNAKMVGSSFDDVNLQRAAFTNVNLSDATFVNVNLTNVSIQNANLSGMKINGVLVYDMMQAYEGRSKSVGGSGS